MPENRADNENTGRTAPPAPQTNPYPARHADNGEEQRNRLGYMATEPTQDEIEGDGDTIGETNEPTNPTDSSAPSAA